MSILSTLLFPPCCVGCEKFGTVLCLDCYEQLEFIPIPITLKLSPLYLDQVITACNYQEPLTTIIQHLKYQSVKKVAEILGQLLYDAVSFPTCDVITAVPLHPKKYGLRGFSQSEEIAKKVSALTAVPYYPLLIKTKHTKAQAEIKDREQRLHHLEQCFAIHPQLPTSFPTLHPSVLLIDDVVTTGSTLNACAQVLKARGFQKVVGLTVGHGQ